MEKNPSWEANRLTGSQIPHILWNLNVHDPFPRASHRSLFWARAIHSMTPIPFPKYPFSYHPSVYIWVFQWVSFTQAALPNACIHLFSPPYVLHNPPISFFSILSPEEYLVRSTDHKASQCLVFSTLLLTYSS